MYFIQFDLARTLRDDRLHEAEQERSWRRLRDEQTRRGAGPAQSAGHRSGVSVSAWSRIARGLGM